MSNNFPPRSAKQPAAQNRLEDGAAFQRIYDSHFGPLLRLAGAKSWRDPQAALEMVQDTFSHAFEQIRANRFKPRHAGAIRSWLSRILVNKLHDRSRVRQRHPLQSLDDLGKPLASWNESAPQHRQPDSPGRIADRRETTSAVDAALARMNLDDREIVRLRYGHGIPFKQLCLDLQLRTPGQVRVRARRALARLRRMLAAHRQL